MDQASLLNPESAIHQLALEKVTTLWPFILQLVQVRPALADSMRAVLPPPLQPSIVFPHPRPKRKPKPKDSRIDFVLHAMQSRNMSLGLFLHLLFERTPDGRTRSHMHVAMVTKFLHGDTNTHADEIVKLMYDHLDSAPRATRGESRRSLRPKDPSRMARARIAKWATMIVTSNVKREMGVLVDPKTSQLRPRKGFSWTDLNGASMEHFSSAVHAAAPTLNRLLLVVTTTTSLEDEIDDGPGLEVVTGRGKAKRDPKLVVTCAIMMLAAVRAARANMFQRFIGAWLWSVCAPAALYSILCRAGLCVSYTTVLRFLHELARNNMLELHALLSVTLWIVIYDNINRRHRIWQPKLGQTWEQLNGTAPTVVATDETDFSILDPLPVEDARRKKKRLALTAEGLRESIDLPHQRRVMACHCLLFLCSWVGTNLRDVEMRTLELFRTALAKRRVPAGRKSAVYPLGTSAFNEATTRGTQDVIDDIFLKQLARTPDELISKLQVVGGDQLTVARLRSLQGYMATCPHGYPALKWPLVLVLVWHMGWADLARLIQTHYGRGAGGDPSALHHINVLLKRRVKDEDRPDFYPALRLVSETLKADTLNCWMLALGTEDLRAHFESGTYTFEQLESLAYTIVDQHFNLAAAESAERGRGSVVTRFTAGDAWVRPSVHSGATDGTGENIPGDFAGDQTLANSIRRRRDSMLQYEFQHAISDGDFGRAWQVMLGWTSTFAGSGHTKYQDELLELYCNFTYEYPEKLTNFIWDNSVASLTGKPHSYVPLDLIQEWMIGEIKSHLARSDEAFDSKFVREIVAPNVRGAQECKLAIRRMFGLTKQASHHRHGLDDECVARLLRDMETTQPNRFRRGRHYGHVAHDDDAAGFDELEGGKVRSFLKRTTSDVWASAEAEPDGHEAGTPSVGAPASNLSSLVDGVFSVSPEDEDVWDGDN